LAGLVTASALSPIWRFSPSAPLFGSATADFIFALVVALIFGVPFYGLVIFIFRSAAVLILKRPFVWCVGIPALLLTGAVLAFPPARYEGIHWIALIPLSALFSGAAFYGWHRLDPLSLT
jgi:hypothetical protein